MKPCDFPMISSHFIGNSTVSLMKQCDFSTISGHSICNSTVPLMKPCDFPTISGHLISNSTVRLMKPACNFFNEWWEEPAAKQAERVVDILYSESVPEYTDQYSSMDTDKEKQLYSATGFTFMFYFLNCVLMNNGEVVGKDETVMSKCLRLIAEHAQMRHELDGGSKQVRPLPLGVHNSSQCRMTIHPLTAEFAK